ncbi:hypothetical protein [Streptomyces sp. NPDC001404]|uniref:hypothetical protein n=1 Tax=Streptomyces sp. NPDC001404 TaxID=3364571 RepID=UPI00367B5945
MANTTSEKPGSSKRNEVVNLRHGGKKDLTCPRCHYRRDKEKPRHSVPELVDSEKLRGAVGELRDAILAKGKFEDEAFMLGVLEAKVRGREYYLAACSSGRIDISPYLGQISYHKGSWKLPATEAAVPRIDGGRWTGDGWRTIKWEKVDIPLQEGGQAIPHIDQTCAAMKLLLGLGCLLRGDAWGAVEYVRMSEMYYVGPQNTTASRQWHGEGETCSWTAHSCRPCNIRIPYLLCDIASNWM